MRFLHKYFAPVRQHLLETAREISMLEWELRPVVTGIVALPWTLKRRPAHGPRLVDISDVEAMFLRGEVPENAGTALLQYFHVNAPPSNRAVSLAAAVEHVEAYGNEDEILLAGYPDGGLISVSRWQLPFQHSADAASWWGP